MIRFAAAVVALALVAGVAEAGKYNKVLNIGDPAPSFEGLKNTVDGKSLSSKDLKSDVQVYIVTCNSCPVAVAYEDRMIEFAKKYKGKIDMVAFCVNTNDANSPEMMAERAKEKGFNFPYAYDASQEIGKKLGATKTPEFFVVSKGKIVYMGAMDDKQDPSKVTKKYLEDAVEAALKGEMPAVTETAAFGCGVPYKRK